MDEFRIYSSLKLKHILQQNSILINKATNLINDLVTRWRHASSHDVACWRHDGELLRQQSVSSNRIPFSLTKPSCCTPELPCFRHLRNLARSLRVTMPTALLFSLTMTRCLRELLSIRSRDISASPRPGYFRSCRHFLISLGTWLLTKFHLSRYSELTQIFLDST